MKKLLFTMLAFVLATGIFAPIALSANEIGVTIDGVAVDFEGQGPTIVDGRTLVPVRGVFEHLGFDVDWEQDTQTATLIRDYLIITITVGDEKFGIEQVTPGQEASGGGFLDVPAQIIEGRTLLPIRTVLESIGYFVDWDGVTSTVNVSSTPIEGVMADDDYIIIGGENFSTSLTVLELSGADLQDEDIIALQYMVNLTELWLSMNEIRDISPLANLTNLTVLALAWNEISDLSPLANLTNLTMLNLGGNQIVDLAPLAGLDNLSRLFLHSNQISDISPLEGLLSLEILWLGDNELSNINELEGLVNLTELDLDSNQITDFEPIAELVNLQFLSASLNQISDISSLANLTNLTVLRLWDNQIVDISSLANLSSESIVLLYGNPIEDWSPIAHIEEVEGRP
ncbi:MAG: leucine-rich repeat domain-containing protein [Defluviitaleaceae bacterium]|nr:leucine-rich repeat domain-containing protein [Defluviitaleaceae bacterium]